MTYHDRILAQVVEQWGWRLGTTLENRVAWRLHRFGIRPLVLSTSGRSTDPRACVQQHRVGRYRLDFAFPVLAVALEADGWYHRSPEAAARDAERDRWLRRQGWLVLRINDEPDDNVFQDQILRVVEVVSALAGSQLRWRRTA